MNIDCTQCKKQFYISPSRVGIKHLCSKACEVLYRKQKQAERKLEMTTCLCGCGKQMHKYNQAKGYNATHPRKYIFGHWKLAEELKVKHPAKTNHQVGSKHWNWKGGIHKKDKTERVRFLKYSVPKVLARDNYTCQICDDYGSYMHVDHIKQWSEFPELRFDLNNCRTLCRSCHYYITFKRKIPNGSRWGLTNILDRKVG